MKIKVTETSVSNPPAAADNAVTLVDEGKGLERQITSERISIRQSPKHVKGTRSHKLPRSYQDARGRGQSGDAGRRGQGAGAAQIMHRTMSD